jgi:hypothetical protein
MGRTQDEWDRELRQFATESGRQQSEEYWGSIPRNRYWLALFWYYTDSRSTIKVIIARFRAANERFKQEFGRYLMTENEILDAVNTMLQKYEICPCDECHQTCKASMNALSEVNRIYAREAFKLQPKFGEYLEQQIPVLQAKIQELNRETRGRIQGNKDEITRRRQELERLSAAEQARQMGIPVSKILSSEAKIWTPEPKNLEFSKIEIPHTIKIRSPEFKEVKLPNMTQAKLPEISEVNLPEMTQAKLPEISEVNLPEMTQAKLPEMSEVKLPNMTQAKLPEMSEVKLPNMTQAKLPEMSEVNLPNMTQAKLPEMSEIGLPETVELKALEVEVVEFANLNVNFQAFTPGKTVAARSPDIKSANIKSSDTSLPVVKSANPDLQKIDTGDPTFDDLIWRLEKGEDVSQEFRVEIDFSNPPPVSEPTPSSKPLKAKLKGFLASLNPFREPEKEETPEPLNIEEILKLKEKKDVY